MMQMKDIEMELPTKAIFFVVSALLYNTFTIVICSKLARLLRHYKTLQTTSGKAKRLRQAATNVG